MTEEPQNESTTNFLTGRGPIILLGILLIFSLIAVCGLGYALYRNFGPGGIGDGGEGEPTPFPQAVGSTNSGREAIVYGISDSTTISVTLDSPVALTLDNRNFPITPQTMNSDGTWSPGLADQESAGWVFGSIINYIIALQDSSNNQALLQSMTPGKPIVLTTQNGTDLVFEVEDQLQIAVNDQAIFNQLSPGLTLIMLGTGGDERLVVKSRFLQTTSPGDTSGSVVNIGEAAQLQDLQVTVTKATYLPNNPNSPPGFSFFILDFQLFNSGSTPVNLSTLQLTLIDEIGNQYVLNPVASQLGENQPLTGGFLNGGQALSGSVGYQIPSGLTSNSLTMRITSLENGASVQVNIPFTGSSASQVATITLQSVTVSEDLTSMTLVGQITNNGDQTIIITQEDVSLRTPDGASYLLLAVNPPFPWTIPAGQTMVYSVTYQRPTTADTAVFTILNQPYQLTGLR